MAEPTLTAVSGQDAKFTAGGEFPVPVPDSDGNITIEYKPFGVILNFTPTVLSQGRIGIKVRTEVSEISSNSTITLNDNVAPILNSRIIETSIELPSGGAMAMAGLIKDVNEQTIKAFGSEERAGTGHAVPQRARLYLGPDRTGGHRDAIHGQSGGRATSDRSIRGTECCDRCAGDPAWSPQQDLRHAGAAPNGVYHGNVGHIVK